AKLHDANTFRLLDTVPGVGKILALVLLYEIHDISRFPTVQDFVSYCRLVKPKKESAGKTYGFIGAKIGNAHLKWAFSEASVLFLRNNPEGQAYVARLEKKHSKGKALTILAHGFTEQTSRTGFHEIPDHAGRRNRLCKPGADGQ